MPISAALSCLFLVSSPAAPAPQTLNPTGAKVKSAFMKLDAAWDMGISGRPKLPLTGWSLIGGFVSGANNTYSWSVPMKANQSLTYTIVGDNSVKTIIHRIYKDAEKEAQYDMSTEESNLGFTYTAPAAGTYRFQVACQKGLNSPAFMLMAFESTSGHTVSKQNMKEIADAAGIVYTEATGAEGGMEVGQNRATFFGGAWDKVGSKTVINIAMPKVPAAFIGAMEGDREGFQMSITDKDGNVLVKDPEDEQFAYCVIEKAVTGAKLTISSQSAKPRVCFVAGFQVK